MSALYIYLAGIIWAVMAVISMFANVKVNNVRINNPLIRALVGPFIIVVCGIVFMVAGAIGTSPITLLLYGYTNYAIVAFLILVGLSAFTKLTMNSVVPPLPVRMLVGTFFLLVGGALFLALGAIMASPVILVVLAL